MTGAPMPDGADAIVMVERTDARDGDDGVVITLAVDPGQHVRRAGGDLEAGDVVFEPGDGADRGADRCARRRSTRRRVRVYPRARVGVLSTGDELVESGPLAPGKIRDSNRPMLLAQLAGAGAEPIDLGSAHDDEAFMTSTLGDAIARCDAVITSGGVSVGDFDYVSDALERSRATTDRADHASTGTRWRSSRRSRCASRWCAARRCSGSPATRCRRS